MATVDLNCDCGEGFGPWSMGDDAAMLAIVTSANVACGFHAGDPDIMADTFALARARGVVIGAHPGFDDRAGFGRRPMQMAFSSVERLVAYQTGAAQALAHGAGTRVSYVKPHGALSNMAMRDRDLAEAIVRGIKGADLGLALLAVAGTELQAAGERGGLTTFAEIYADRGYTDEGDLAPRSSPGAVIHDSAVAAERVVRMVEAGAVISMTGKTVPVAVHSICVHGDTPTAVATARAVRAALAGAGVALEPFIARDVV